MIDVLCMHVISKITIRNGRYCMNLYTAMEHWFPTIPTLTTIWRLC